MNAPDDSTGTWLDELLNDLSFELILETPWAEKQMTKLRAAILAHLQEREAAQYVEGRIAALDWLKPWLTPEFYASERRNEVKKLLAVREGRA